MSARYSRGSSVLAALILAAFVGGVILSIHQIANTNQPSLAYSASAPAASSDTPATPQCNALPAVTTVQISDGQADKQPCVCQVAPGQTFRNVKYQNRTYFSLQYTVQTILVNGSVKAQTKMKVSDTQGPDNTNKCIVQYCGLNGTGCKPALTFSANQLGSELSSRVASAPTDFYKSTAVGLLEGSTNPTALSGQINNSTQEGIRNALTDLKQNPAFIDVPSVGSVQTDTTYSPNKIDDALSDLGKVVTCTTDCTNTPPLADQPNATPFEIDKAIKDSQAGLTPDQATVQTSAGDAPTPGDYQGENPQAIDAAIAASKVTAGDIVSSDYYCIKQILPVLVVKVPAGSAFPSGCYNDKNAPPLPPASTFNQPPGAGGSQLAPASGGGGLGNGFLGGLMKTVLGGLVQGLHQMLNQPPQQACTGDANAYNQALQQYQQQMQQYNQQLQQYNYQSQIAQMQGYPTPPQPVAPSQPCYTAPPARPAGSGGSGGSGGPATGTPTAQISCSPQTADVGQTIAISFGCGNASGSAGSGFDTGNQLSGSASTTISNPPAGAKSATYALLCRNQSATTQAQCSVAITRPSIILVANPKVIAVNASSTIGWVTTGMQSCVISSPDSQQFTAQNATNNSVNGVAITPALASSASFILNCTTMGGQSKSATTVVQVGSSGGGQGAVTVTSSADGASIARGDTVNISWSSANAPSGSHIQLWLFDTALQSETALIQSDLSASSTYAWVTPSTSSTCPSNSPYVCSSDLVPGRSYAIEADLFTGASTSPTYIDHGFTPSNFGVSQ